MNEARRALYALSGALYDECMALNGARSRGDEKTYLAVMQSMSRACEKAADKLKAYERSETSIPEKV